jgi:hypothetical protein
VVIPAKNSVKVLLDEIIFYIFEIQNFKPIFVWRKTIFWGFSKVLSPQKIGSPNPQITKIYWIRKSQLQKVPRLPKVRKSNKFGD